MSQRSRNRRRRGKQGHQLRGPNATARRLPPVQESSEAQDHAPEQQPEQQAAQHITDERTVSLVTTEPVRHREPQPKRSRWLQILHHNGLQIFDSTLETARFVALGTLDGVVEWVFIPLIHDPTTQWIVRGTLWLLLAWRAVVAMWEIVQSSKRSNTDIQ
jgi:hypothetical protein